MTGIDQEPSPVMENHQRLGYLTAYGLGLVLVATVVSVANFASAIVGNPAGVPLNVLCLVAFLSAAGAAAVRVLRGSRWHWLAGLWLASTLGATLLLRSSLPVDALSESADWSLGAFGFVAVAVLFGQPIGVLLVAQFINCVYGLPWLLASGLFDQARLVQFFGTAVSITVFPLAAALFFPQLEDVAMAAQRDGALRQKLLARESIAQQIATDRMHRAEAIEASAAPLLRALSQGQADPQDPLVQRAARIESARMRRMFAEVDDTSEPMLHEIRASIDAAERLGVTVTLETRGQLPALPVALRRSMLESPMSALASAVSTARVVVVAGSDSVSVSVVTDGPPGVVTGSPSQERHSDGVPAPTPLTANTTTPPATTHLTTTPLTTTPLTTTMTAENMTYTQTSWRAVG